MFIFNRLQSFFNSMPTLKLKDLKSLIGKCKNFIKETKVKLNNLSTTNFNLGIYHFNKGNLNDAILRFKLVKQFDKRHKELYKDLDYFLGRSYLEKLKYNKARGLLENYMNNNPKFSEEAEYCLKIIKNELHDIKFVPVTIIDHKFNQQFDSYVKVAKNFERKSPKNTIYEEIKEALEDDEKVFNYNMLDLGCGLGLVAYLLRKNQLLHFVLGVEINKNMVEYCKKLTINSNKVYNTIINQDTKTFLNSKAKTDSKFDIILGTNLISYSTDLKFLFTKLKSYIGKNGIMTFSFNAKQGDDGYNFDAKLENFIYNQDYVVKVAENCGWQIVKQEEIKARKNHYPQVTMVLKLK